MAQPWDHSTCWSLWDSFQRSQVQGLPQLHSKVNSLRRARGVEKKEKGVISVFVECEGMVSIVLDSLWMRDHVLAQIANIRSEETEDFYVDIDLLSLQNPGW